MSNRYGITLDSEWIEWAANEKVSETVAAALLLICQSRPVHEVVAKLATDEFERVVDIVRRSPDHFPSGTLAALKSRSPIAAPPSDGVSADQAFRQSTKPQSDKKCGSIGNRFGIALDQSWLRWAAAESVSETVIAAVLLLRERSVEEIAGKLTPAELADVTRLVSRCPSCYPPGAYDALKARRNVAAEQPATTAGAGANRPRRRHMPASAELKRRRLAERTNRVHASGANAQNVGTGTGTLADILRRRMVVEDLRGLGLSIRGIAAATGIPRSSVHRAVRAMARARAKQEADTIEIMRKLLGKRLRQQGGHSRG
jgi:hypothetical protein